MEDAELLTHPGGLRALDYAAIVAYLALTFGISVWFGRKQQTTEDFFVGGRRMPWIAVGLSIIATLFSTLSYLGVPGEMINKGAALFMGYLALPFTFLVITFLWIPFFMSLRLTSAYEYLERRFSRPVRTLGATLFLCLRLGWMSMVVYAASLALDQVKGGDIALLPGPDLYYWIVAIGVTAAIYTAVGGIQAMIWVDVIQCILLLFGVLLAIGFVYWHDGGGPLVWWNTARAAVPAHATPPFFSTDLTIRNTILFTMINYFFWHICTHGSDQVVLQRYFSTSSLAAARRSYFTNVLVDTLMASLLSLAGLALLAFYLRHANLLPEGHTAITMADKLFPHFLGNQLPVGCAGLIISAFLCDAIQTLESGVNAITAVVTKDFFSQKLTKPEAEAGQLTAARRLSVLISVVVTAAAFGVVLLQRYYQLSLVDMMPKFFNMFVGPLAGMFFVGMFLPRAQTRSVLPAALVAICVAIIWSWWEQIFRTSWRPTIFLSIALPCTTTFVLSAILSLFVEKAEVHPGSEYTWWAVMRRAKFKD